MSNRVNFYQAQKQRMVIYYSGRWYRKAVNLFTNNIGKIAEEMRLLISRAH